MSRMAIEKKRPAREWTKLEDGYEKCVHHFVSNERPIAGVITFKCLKCNSIMQEPASLIDNSYSNLYQKRLEARAEKLKKEARIKI